MNDSNLGRIEVTDIYWKNLEAKTRFVLNEGGTHSSKTYSLCQLFLTLATLNKNKRTILSIVRKTFPALRATAMHDFFDILNDHNLYDPRLHNMSDHIYRIGKCEIEFFSTDDAQKMHGRKRDFLWINEANELSSEDFFQLNIRTRKQVYMDYNPSEIVHWLYDHPSIQADCTLIHSTYKDNPFADERVVREIEALEHQDDEYWKIYGLGQRAVSKKQIYHNWNTVSEIPELEETFYGLDFGHTHPTALIKIVRKEDELWERELLYEGMTNAELIVRMTELIPKDAEIWADSEAPDRIQEIHDAGWMNIKPAEKQKGSVEFGIGLVKRYKIHVHEDSVHLVKEKQTYKWSVDKDGNIAEGRPLKFNDHLMDAERYAVVGHCVEEVGAKVVFVI